MSKSIRTGRLVKFCMSAAVGVVIQVFAPYSAYSAALDNGAEQLARPPELFTSFFPQAMSRSDVPPRAAKGREIVRSRQVNIDLGLLSSAADTSPGRRITSQIVALNLFDGVTFLAQRDRVEQTPRGVVWIGHLQGVDLSQVVLALHGNTISGNVSMPGARYHIRFAGNGTHEVQEIDQSRFPRDEPFVPIPDQSALDLGAASSRIPGAQADDGSIIDVMVMYTAAARAGAFGTSAINSEIDLAISETNQSYLNSGITQRLRLVHAEEVAYAETGLLDDDLECITSATDGCLDNVHSLRDTYGADLVSFWIEDGGEFCGIAWLMSSVSASFESHGFSVVPRDCAVLNLSFAHELGHNMGARHDAYVDKNTTTPYPYAHGYLNTSAASPWRTIMSYNNACTAVGKDCTRIQYWSNPAITYDGVPMGTAAAADDHRALNDTAPTVANFRATVIPTTNASSTVIEFYNSSLDNFFITADTNEAAAIDSGSAGPGWSRTGYTFKSGGTTSVCRFYGSVSPGPNSHFYTVNAAECNYLKQLQAMTPDTEKRWNFEGLNFLSSAAANRVCASGTVPVYRAYNNGFARGVDSNHRITSSLTALQEEVNKGWSNEGVVMCAPA